MPASVLYDSLQHLKHQSEIIAFAVWLRTTLYCRQMSKRTPPSALRFVHCLPQYFPFLHANISHWWDPARETHVRKLQFGSSKQRPNFHAKTGFHRNTLPSESTLWWCTTFQNMPWSADENLELHVSPRFESVLNLKAARDMFLSLLLQKSLGSPFL